MMITYQNDRREVPLCHHIKFRGFKDSIH
uniref:Uncharacterized protein n=1 Tax=Arundo donax TaxID=35708 RepID=A0A0A9A0S3_ARUDO